MALPSHRDSHTRSHIRNTLPVISPRSSLHRIKRYDGLQKSSRAWDRLRRDEELYVPQGDCLIHLYAVGTSQRGPSLRVPLAVLQQANSRYLWDQCLHKSESSASSISEDDSSDSGYGASVSSDRLAPLYELYIPAPPELSRQEAFAYHIGTRNFFAYLLSRPVVGESLGRALAGLASRIEAWQPNHVASTDFLDYCQGQGYLDFAESPDYAAASLYLAEHARIKDIWLDAFAHCVGMRDDLENCPENLTNTTLTLIRRASLEMELHVDRATRSLGEFLEDELGPENLGLSKAMRAHLDRFRSCLHSYYVHSTGYFPPPDYSFDDQEQHAAWDKQLWCTMYEDFRSLYEFLADPQSSSTDLANNRGLDGGVCVVQNIQAFDRRHGFDSLPHPLPLLPEALSGARAAGEAQKGLRNSLRLVGRIDAATASAPQSHVSALLRHAADAGNAQVTANRLVQEYIRFEQLRLEEKVSVSEARKVRWILVYGVLQMLISITRAPAEVQDTLTPTYPLCIPTHICPPWTTTMTAPAATVVSPQVKLVEARLSAEMASVRRTFEADRISIHPDCEADSADDYFSMNGHGSLQRSTSDVNILSSASSLVPSPLRTNATAAHHLTRTTSLRTSVSSLHRSVVDGLARRSTISTRPSPPPPQPTQQQRELSFCEIIVEGYGNGSLTPPSAQTPLETATPIATPPIPPRNPVPTVQLHQLDTGASCARYNAQPSPVDSSISSPSSFVPSPTSVYSSESAGEYNSQPSELATPREEEGEAAMAAAARDGPSGHPRVASIFDMDDFSAFDFGFHQPHRSDSLDGKESYLPQPLTYHAKRPSATLPSRLNAGCYVPTSRPPLQHGGGGGVVSPPPRRSSSCAWTTNPASAAAAPPPPRASSPSSSVYSDDDDDEEEEEEEEEGYGEMPELSSASSPSPRSSLASSTSSPPHSHSHRHHRTASHPPRQAAEIEEEEPRGRRRLRGLDRLRFPPKLPLAALKLGLGGEFAWPASPVA